MGTKGRPRVSDFVKISIAYKVIQYSKRWNETHYRAWLRFVKVKAFKDLMQEHYKNTKHREHWTRKLTQSTDSQRKFYSKHIKSFIKEYKLNSGIGSLKEWLNRVR